VNSFNTTNLRDTEIEPNDPEISLGASTILGIFLGLTLVCALFFGFGYSMGHRSSPPPAVDASSESTPSPTSTAPKPSPGSFATIAPAETEPTPTASAPAITATSSTESAAKTVAKSATTTAAPVPAIEAGSFVVQIAAVSHREDADSLIGALQQRGYTVFIRQEPQDKLMHVQVGPFISRKDADTMRQHLLYDGYNAIIK
jgi:DedD protein